MPQGGYISNYLLEKSRICKPSVNERNFHIFYQLLSSKYIKNLHLTSCADYEYLQVSKCYKIDHVSDVDEFDITFKALQKVGFRKAEIQQIFIIIASILHLGNIKFSSKRIDDDDGSEVKLSETPGGNHALELFTSLLELNEKKLKKVLCFRTLHTMGAGGKRVSFRFFIRVRVSILNVCKLILVGYFLRSSTASTSNYST